MFSPKHLQALRVLINDRIVRIVQHPGRTIVLFLNYKPLRLWPVFCWAGLLPIPTAVIGWATGRFEGLCILSPAIAVAPLFSIFVAGRAAP